ncbi:hypothetical protein [Paraburkholderia fungorum]|uniref:Adenylate/guanylate cyclase domain-containing protein n=1 Tax=Paraburkholderia fungorum TaxID=134537 RepID=A0AAW3UU06_9BURK|nr:hypothetical protein [Paraburkholderia fungorum]MBB4519740.1 hypothetical protein [Paraburkholderia fungorum]MBB6201231.1 hypothetical protein [Paraburkholderia fungorum]
MLSPSQKQTVRTTVREGLQRAIVNWTKVGRDMVRKATNDSVAMEASAQKSIIPGHPWVSDGVPKVDEFVAVVVDMRNSSQHLKSRINRPRVQHGFQRIYYETSALLPAIAVTSSFEGGTVTEYLGDGALVLFPVDTANRARSVRDAYRAADNCVRDMRDIVNEEISGIFDLPPIDIGVGLSLSKALVTLVGADPHTQPKAIGECVWEATKLSGGVNTVHVSRSVREAWPSSKNGLLKFTPCTVKGVDGYKVSKESLRKAA